MVELFPFDYQEYCESELNHGPESYLQQGGFPLVLEYSQPLELLQRYFDEIIEKDVRVRLNAGNSLPIKKVIKMLFESVGSEMSLRKIAGSIGLGVDTVRAYIDACEMAYLIYKCPFFSYSERKRAPRNIKYYPVDTGLRRAVVTKAGADFGKDLEAATYLSLRQRTSSICYWKDKSEVDFVVQSQEGLVPIQVSLGEPHDRHHEAIASFYARFPDAANPMYVSLEDLQQNFRCFDELDLI